MRVLRWIAALLVLSAAAAFAYLQNETLLIRKYNRWRYPSIRETSPLAKDIDEGLAVREYNRIAREYRRVQKKLDEAESKGYDVRWLKAKMPNVLRLIKEEKFYFAKIHLNTIDVRIPKERESIVPAGAYDHNEGMTPDIEGGRARPKRTERRTRGRPSRGQRRRQ